MKPSDLYPSKGVLVDTHGVASYTMTAQEAAELAALRARRRGYERFHDFVARVTPRYRVVPKHLEPLYDLIERSREEPIRGLVSLPPRHGKTVTLTLAILWRCLLDPVCQNFYTSYNGNFSASIGRVVRELAVKLGIPLSRSSNANAEWNTVYGGGLISTSVGGGITGRGANGGLVVVDDIIKGSKMANSKAVRDEAYTYVTTDVMSRLEGGGSMLIVGTRWHEDDPQGRIIADAAKNGGEALGETWSVINIPAIGDAFGRPIDERVYPALARPLWNSIDETQPANDNAALEWYRKVRARNELSWWALYQGVPRSPDSKMFLEPASMPMPLQWGGKRGCLVLDPAATARTTSDWSALGAFAMDGYGDTSKMYVPRVKKMHATQPAVAREARRWQQHYGRGRLLLCVEAVGGFTGIPQMLREMQTKIRLHELRPGARGWLAGDKKTRAVPVSGAWNESRVLVPTVLDDTFQIPEGHNEWYDLSWTADYIEVMQAFSGTPGDEDDVVDITAHAWNTLYRAMPGMGYGDYRIAG